MPIQVLLFATARDIAGVAKIEIPIEFPTTVAAIRSRIVGDYPELAPIVQRSRMAIDLEYRSDADTIESAKEVALIPPVSGG